MVLRDKIYNTIKERITSGKYAPGQPLDEKQIIEELRTSRTPFREAINALSEEGLVEVYPYRGIFVRDLSVKDIADGFDIRLLLEPKVLELASYRIPASKINEMIERIEHIDKTNYVALLNEDGYFHETLISYIDNQQLIKIMKTSTPTICFRWHFLMISAITASAASVWPAPFSLWRSIWIFCGR